MRVVLSTLLLSVVLLAGAAILPEEYSTYGDEKQLVMAGGYKSVVYYVNWVGLLC